MSTITEGPKEKADAVAVEQPVLSALPIAELSDEMPDGSKITDRKRAAKLFEAVREALTEWQQAFRRQGTATRTVALAILDIRRLCVRSDNGHPDWSGQHTLAYKAIYADRIRGVYKSLGMTEQEITRFEDAVRGYMRDSGLTGEYIAKFKTETVSGLAKFADAVKPGEELPAELKKAVADEYASQVTTTGKAYRGFEPDKVPEVIGPKAKASGGSTGAGNTGQRNPSRAWQTLREEVSVHENAEGNGGLAPEVVSDELLHLATAFSIRLTGKSDEKAPSVRGRKKVIETLKECASLLTKSADYLDGTLKDREKIAEHYWQG